MRIMNIRPTWPQLLALAAAAIYLVLSFGFLGRVHMAFDAFSHFRIHFAVLLALTGLLLVACRGWRLAGCVALMAAAAAMAATIGPARFTGSAVAKAAEVQDAIAGPHYRLLQINLRFDNPTPERVLSLIGQEAPDVITLDEVPERWREKLALTEAAYPYRIVCPPPSYIGGVAILSRRPFSPETKPRCYDRGSMAIAKVEFGGRSVTIVALHLGWPWPFDQPYQIPDLAPTLESQVGKTAILAGDFNAAPWSETVRRVAEAAGMEIVRGIGPTWLHRALPDPLRRIIGLPIDNILVKGDVALTEPRRLEDVGSDHLPVLMEFGLKPNTDTPEAMQARLGQ